MHTRSLRCHGAHYFILLAIFVFTVSFILTNNVQALFPDLSISLILSECVQGISDSIETPRDLLRRTLVNESPYLLDRDTKNVPENNNPCSAEPASCLDSRAPAQKRAVSIQNRQSDSLDKLLGDLLSGASDFSSILSGILCGGPSVDLDQSVFSLGMGVATGVSDGLNLNTQAQTQAIVTNIASENGVNLTGANGAAMNLGNGLVSAAVPLIESGNFASNPQIQAIWAAIQPYIPPALYGVGNGSANGIVVGLQLADVNATRSSGTGFADSSYNLGLGLTETLASTINSTLVEDLLMAKLPGLLREYNVSGVLEDAGQGLGAGLASGLGIVQQTSTSPLVNDSPIDVYTAVQDLTGGLVASLDKSVNISLALSKLTGVNTSIGSPVADVATSLVRGVFDGAFNNQTTELSATAKDARIKSGLMSRSVIEDELDDAVTAFGRGLGYELAQIYYTVSGEAEFATARINPWSVVSRNIKRHVFDGTTDLVSLGRTALQAVGTRATRRRDTVNSTQQPLFTSQVLTRIAQKTVDLYGCDGVSGIASIVNGLYKNKIVSHGPVDLWMQQGRPTEHLVPKDLSVMHYRGNTFKYNLRSTTESFVNGLSSATFEAMLLLHVGGALSSFLGAYPLFLILNIAPKIAALTGRYTNSRRMKRWQRLTFYVIFLPLALATTAFGFVGYGNSRHLRRPHGILGFVTTVWTFVTAITYFARSRKLRRHSQVSIFPLRDFPRKVREEPVPFGSLAATSILLTLIFATFITGFDDFGLFSMCYHSVLVSFTLWVFLITTMVLPLTAAGTLIILSLWIESKNADNLGEGNIDMRTTATVSQPVEQPIKSKANVEWPTTMINNEEETITAVPVVGQDFSHRDLGRKMEVL